MKIAGARVYDPVQGLSGERRDILITGGRIGGFGEGEAIDARGCIALAGALDIHAHLFGPTLLESGEAAGWGDAAAAARRMLALGYSFWLEPGLPATAADAFEAFSQTAPIDGAWLSMDGPHGKAAGQKLFGEEGIAALFSNDFSERPHLHLPSLAQGEGFSRLAAFARESRHAGKACHLAHLSHYAFERVGSRLLPRGAQAARILDGHPLLSADCGPVVFGPALTFTADAELAGRIARNGGGALRRAEGMPYQAAPYEFRKERYIDALLWLAAMEFILSTQDLARLSLSIDYPSGGAPEGYPAVMAMLMERDRRDAFCTGLNPDAVAASALPGIRRELSLAELALITRAAPASAAALPDRGHLGAGARADIVLCREEGDAEKMFAVPHLVIKGGKVVVEDGIWK